MFENQSVPTNSSVLVNSMEELFDLIETDNFYPFISNSSINDNDKNKTTYQDLTTIENITNDQDMFLYSDEINFLDDASIVNTFDDSESSSDNDDDEEPFDLREWMIEDVLSHKIRRPKLYEFLRLLLDNSRYISFASWLNKNEGLFKIHRPIQVACLWKKVKVRKTDKLMDYDTFARGIRYYYKSGSMIKTRTKHTYRFAQIF